MDTESNVLDISHKKVIGGRGNNRLHWIDICKGILILLMVCGHIPNIAGHKGVDVTYLSKYGIFAQAYICFFMQAFFILTGYTSNFNKAPKTFLVSALKTIVVPWLSFSCILKLLNGLIFNDWSLVYVIDGQSYFFLFEDYWFLHALFLSKVSYYFAYRNIKNDYANGIIFLMLAIIGFQIMLSNKDNANAYHYQNWLHYRDFLCMAIFVWIGNLLKRKSWLTKKTCNVALVLYVILWLAFLFAPKLHLGRELITPIVLSHSCNLVSILQVPAYMLFVLSGSLACFRICMILKENSFVEYFGRNSIIVYCVHFLFIGIAVNVLKIIIAPVTIIGALTFAIATLCITLLMSKLSVQIFTRRPFCYALGKF